MFTYLLIAKSNKLKFFLLQLLSYELSYLNFSHKKSIETELLA
jgi:hypothetical protein